MSKEILRPAYLIYHPQRTRTKIGEYDIYHDGFNSNEDPYIWNEQFLHSFCHITQLPNEVGQINFWVSSTNFSTFPDLLCDCVFLVQHKIFWSEANHIDIEDPLVDSPEAYRNHYKPGISSHVLSRRRRYTLKAHPLDSFQPQNGNGELLNILDFLLESGLSLQVMLAALHSNRGSRPMRLPNGLGDKLYAYLAGTAAVKIIGSDLRGKHPDR